MNEMRDITDEMSAEEGRLLAERRQDSVRTNAFLLSITIAGAALIILLAVLSIVLLKRTNRERDAARRELETANANLESTVRERTAELSEANEEIQRFAYIVSHDLRSPLVNIMGFTAELQSQRREMFDELARLRDGAGEPGERDAALAAEFDEAISFIKSSTEKMDRLISAVLKLSREGRRQFRPEPIDMTALVDDIVATVSHQVALAGARVEVAPLPPVVSDRLAVEQTLSNLIDNAVKYLKPDTPGIIRVDGRATATHVLYNVRDNGRGIDPRDQQRVFELFRRAGAQDRPGEGIGLAHVRTLVRRLGGTLTLQSKPGEGSTFTVILPKQLTYHPESTAA
jgi:signal transduction histidine kinase